jgi:hypothetical protein
VLHEREAQAELERADRRNPRETHTIAVTQAVRADAVAFRTPDVTAVEEGKDTQRAVIARARQRERQFDVTHQQLRAADRVVRLRVARTQRARLVAPHRTDTARVVILENRIWLAAKAVTVTALEVEAQHEAARERIIVLRVDVGLVVLRAAERRAVFGVRLRKVTAARHQCAVARVA